MHVACFSSFVIKFVKFEKKKKKTTHHRFTWIVKVWNSLSHSIKHATSVQHFKKLLQYGHYKTKLSSYRPL